MRTDYVLMRSISSPVATGLSRSATISLLLRMVDEEVNRGRDIRYRDAVRAVAVRTGLPVLEVRRMTRFHPLAP
jgi:hypothetical protein